MSYNHFLLLLQVSIIGIYSSSTESFFHSLPLYNRLNIFKTSNPKATSYKTNSHSSPHVTVVSNYTIKINTTNMAPECTPECYLNCQVHFSDLTEEKYCIMNVCKCSIIEESKTKPEIIFLKTINTNSLSNNVTAYPYQQQKESSLNKFWNKGVNFAMVAFIGYETLIVFVLVNGGNFDLFWNGNEHHDIDHDNSSLYQELIPEKAGNENEDKDNNEYTHLNNELNWIINQ